METKKLIKKNEEIPINRINIVSYVFVNWMTSLIRKIYKYKDQPLDENDIWLCSNAETAKANFSRVNNEWNIEIWKKGYSKASFLWVWLRFTRRRVLLNVFVSCVHAVLTFLTTGFLLRQITLYLEAPESSVWHGVLLIALTILGLLLRAGLRAFIVIYGNQTGVRFSAGVMGFLYKKMLQMKSIKRQYVSEVTTLFGGDAFRLHLNCVLCTYVFSLPVYVLIAALYLYHLIGLWCFVTIALFVMCFLCQPVLSLMSANLRKQCLVHTDRRIRKITEAINSIKLIKMFTWEEAFTKSIKDVRTKEQKYLVKSAMLNILSLNFISMAPAIAAVITLLLYSNAGNQLDSSLAFTILTTLAFLKNNLLYMPTAIRFFGEAMTSFERIKKLLLQEDYFAPEKCLRIDNTVEIDNATFTWETHKDTNITGNDNNNMENDKNEDSKLLPYEPCQPLNIGPISLNIKMGKLIGVYGPVGCGKSALISSVLGRMSMLVGSVKVSGSVAYVAQQAWIFNDTLRENIIFGKPFDYKWYQTVISVCELSIDFEKLSNGDLTEVGDHGTNLSGGQKQRVSLARAVYSRSDIYLLDDPLSALDTQIGQQVFRKCIKETLKYKTVILATHQQQYLQHCDDILVMEGGRIVERGDHTYLMTRQGFYSDLVQKSQTTGQCHSELQEESLERNKNVACNGIAISSVKSGSGNITVKEEMHVYPILASIQYYMKAAGGSLVTGLLLCCYTLAGAAFQFNYYWLSQWTAHMNSDVDMPYTHKSTPQTNSPSEVLGLASLKNYTNNSSSTEPISSRHSWNIYMTVYSVSLGVCIVLMFVNALYSAVITIRASGKVHNLALDGIMKASLQFFDSNPTGRIINRFSKDQDEGDVFLPMLMNNVLLVLVSVVLSLGLAATEEPWTLIGTVPVVILYYLAKDITAVVLQRFKNLMNVTRSPLLNFVNISAEGLPTIVSLKQENLFLQRCWSLIDKASASLLMFGSSMIYLESRMDLVGSLIVVVTSLVLVLQKGVIPVHSASLTLSLCIMTASVLPFIIRRIAEFESSFTIIERLREYDEKIEKESSSGTMRPSRDWPHTGSISLSDIRMRYRNDLQPVLRNVNFEVKGKEKIGIVGRTGAGKTSIVMALFRLKELCGGTIHIDGTDISQIPLKLLRSKISTIPQDPVLFAGTLRYNLDPFKRFSDNEIWNALEHAHIKDKILQLPNQLYHFVEENGENFSVGERQLICLARAILLHNKILVLDEATASVDSATDAVIQRTIRENFADCTVLTIAHRLNTVMNCDSIVVMDDGKILEVGKRQDLLASQKSIFRHMTVAQQ